jgi:hypothetical protein
MVQRFAELPEDLMDDDGLPTLRASRGMSESQLVQVFLPNAPTARLQPPQLARAHHPEQISLGESDVVRCFLDRKESSEGVIESVDAEVLELRQKTRQQGDAPGLGATK